MLRRTGRGTLLRRDYFNREIWKPAIAAAQIPQDATFHGLRHTFASTALAEGVPISEVSRWPERACAPNVHRDATESR